MARSWHQHVLILPGYRYYYYYDDADDDADDYYYCYYYYYYIIIIIMYHFIGSFPRSGYKLLINTPLHYITNPI